MNSFNLYFVEFALSSLLKNKIKNLFIFVILSFLVFLLTSIFQISYTIKNQTNKSIENLAELTLSENSGGFYRFIESNKQFELMKINGISLANDRVWGYYTFNGHRFTIVGIDSFEPYYKEVFTQIGIENKLFLDDAFMLVGSKVKGVLEEYYFKDDFRFLLSNGKAMNFTIASVLEDKEIIANDMILMNKQNARKILDIPNGYATDIVVQIPNDEEIGTIKYKIQTIYPSFQITSKEELQKTYENMFDYKGGVFLALFVVALFTFFIIIYDKIATSSSVEKKEIAILKALGWSTNDILKVKLYEAFILSVSSYLLGVLFALSYLYFFDGGVFQNLFIGLREIKYNFMYDFSLYTQMYALVFFLYPNLHCCNNFPSMEKCNDGC